MDIAQYFDTTLTDCESALAARLLVIPANSMAPYARAGLLEWTSMLGLKQEAVLENEREVIAVLASLLSAGDRAAVDLATLVVTQPRIPFGHPEAHSASLLAVAQSNAKGGWRGAVTLASLNDWRLLLVTAPGGIVVCGSAEAVSRSLERGISAKIRELMGLDGRDDPSTGPASTG